MVDPAHDTDDLAPYGLRIGDGVASILERHSLTDEILSRPERLCRAFIEHDHRRTAGAIASSKVRPRTRSIPIARK